MIRLDVFKDHRGEYIETYNIETYNKLGINVNFVADDMSVSTYGVLRGIHGDDKTWKLIQCLMGSFYLVVVCNDKDSPSYGEWEGFFLSELDRSQVLVPPKHGNGHLVLSDKAIFNYKQSEQYYRDGQFTIKYNEIEDMWWPYVDNLILSERDK